MTKQQEKNSYRSILKGTSFLGGVQIFLVLINLIRGKFIALLLGPEGMGMANLFNTSSNTVQRFASLGLNLAVVKEVAEHKEDETALSLIKAISARLIMATALIGGLFCVFFAGWLSRLSFGTDEYSWQFMLLGVAVFLTVAGNGKMSVLQGLHEVEALSKSTLYGALSGLLVSVPLYYFFGNKGIVPAMVIFAGVTYTVYSIYLRKKTGKTRAYFSWREHRKEIRSLLGLGLILMASDLLGSLSNYLLSIFLRAHGSLGELGLYQAANSITNQYIGVVFAAMSLDYFPRLTAVASSNADMTEVVNRQSVLNALVTTPMVILLIAFAPLVIKILLSGEFAVVTPLLRLLGVGILFKAFSFPMGYIAFAKGNKMLFFILEGLFGNFLTLALGCVSFYYMGLTGLGYAMVADFGICVLVYYVVNRRMYGYRFGHTVVVNYFAGIVLVAAAFAATLVEEAAVSYSFLSVLSVVSCTYSFFKVRKLVKS